MAGNVATGRLQFDAFIINLDTRRVWKGDTDIGLINQEFDVLVVLTAHPREVVERDVLIAAAWPNTSVSDNDLSTHIKSLRRKIGPREGGRP